MGFFKGFKRDFAQAVNELMPDPVEKNTDKKKKEIPDPFKEEEAVKSDSNKKSEDDDSDVEFDDFEEYDDPKVEKIDQAAKEEPPKNLHAAVTEAILKEEADKMRERLRLNADIEEQMVDAAIDNLSYGDADFEKAVAEAENKGSQYKTKKKKKKNKYGKKNQRNRESSEEELVGEIADEIAGNNEIEAADAEEKESVIAKEAEVEELKSDISKAEDVEEVSAEDKSEDKKEAEESFAEDASSDEKTVEEELDEMEDPEAIIDLDRLDGVSGEEDIEKESIEEYAEESDKVEEIEEHITEDDKEDAEEKVEEIFDDSTKNVIEDIEENVKEDNIEEPDIEELDVDEVDIEENDEDEKGIEERKEDKELADLEDKIDSKEETLEFAPAPDSTYITSKTKVTGNIETDGDIDILGTVTGDVKCKGKLILGGTIKGDVKAGEMYANQAKVEGEIVCDDSVKIGVGTVVIGNIAASSAVIAGAVNGDIDVKGQVIVDSSAVIVGNIKSKSVQINNGAIIEGFCSQAYLDVDVKRYFSEDEKRAAKSEEITDLSEKKPNSSRNNGQRTNGQKKGNK